MHSLLPRHHKSAGFAQTGFVNLEFYAFITVIAWVVTALQFLLQGRWIVATAMVVPVVVLFIWVKYVIGRERCHIGDQIRVSLGPHAGREGAIIGANEAGTRFTVQLSGAEESDPLDFSDYQITKLKLPG